MDLENMWGDLSVILVIVGAINWGLVGVLDFNLVTATIGQLSPVAETVTYALVGVAGIGAGLDKWVYE